ncbi:MAG: MarR family winged helix-turn-helix transcriptional regulator [Kiloniellaceae bacterium]
MDLRLETFLPYRLNRAAAVASKHFSTIYRNEFNLTVPEWRVLATLGQVGRASAKEIGQHSAMHKTKVSRAVSSLQQRRWVARAQDELDRRIEHLSLTTSGKAAFRRLAPKMLAFEDDLLARLDPAARAELLKGLDALERALGIPVAAAEDKIG